MLRVETSKTLAETPTKQLPYILGKPEFSESFIKSTRSYLTIALSKSVLLPVFEHQRVHLLDPLALMPSSIAIVWVPLLPIDENNPEPICLAAMTSSPPALHSEFMEQCVVFTAFMAAVQPSLDTRIG